MTLDASRSASGPQALQRLAQRTALAPPPATARRQTVIGIVLLLVAAALVPTHLAEHAGVLDPLPGNLEDLLLGFPTAGVLGIAGFIGLVRR